MTNGDRIPTPIAHRWRRFRYNVLPVISFALAVMVMLWMWGHQRSKYTTFGKPNARRIDLTTTTEGMVVSVATAGTPGVYTRVAKGDVIAELAPSNFDREKDELAVKTAQEELKSLKAELDAIIESDRLEQYGREHNRLREAIKREWQVEAYKLETINRLAAFQAAKFEKKRWDAEIIVLQEMKIAEDNSNKLVSREQLKAVKAQQDGAAAQMVVGKKAYGMAKGQWDKAVIDIGKLPKVEEAIIEKLLGPARASIRAQDAAIKEIEHRLESLTITAPFDGTIASVLAVPGQTVQAGEPIISLANEKSDFIVVYIRQENGIRLRPGDDVYVRERVRGSSRFGAKVIDVAPQYEPVPEDLLRDPGRPEFALPVRISIPEEIQLRGIRPGELIEVTMTSGVR